MEASFRQSSPIREVGLLFLKLGTIAFGGPAAHIAMMESEVVQRRRWLDRQHFLDLLGATNMIPGPNSTEMAIHIGFVRAGWRGLVVAGICFILPAMLIVSGLAWAYVTYGSRPQAVWLLYGIKPVIIAIIVQALWGLGKTAVKGPLTALVGAAVIVFFFLGTNEILLLFAGGLVAMMCQTFSRWRRQASMWMALAAFALPIKELPANAALVLPPASLINLTLFFLKIGSIIFGSGYVLLAFLKAELVGRWQWLTAQQLLDAVAIGQFTPGPVFTTATFIGFVIGSWPGAILATVGIFLPSFVLVAAVNPLVPRLRRSPWTGGFLDGVNAASVGLMVAVTWELGRAALVDWPTIALASASGLLVFCTRINSAWIVVGGGILALIYQWPT